VSFVTLQGTRQIYDFGVDRVRVGNHHISSWDCTRQQSCINRSCGVSIVVHRRLMRSGHVWKVLQVPSRFACRLGGIRIKNAMLDVFVFSVYTPPNPTTWAAEAKAADFWRSLDRVLSELHARCMPILLGDFNAHLGKADCQHVDAESLSVGRCNAVEENFNGAWMG